MKWLGFSPRDCDSKVHAFFFHYNSLPPEALEFHFFRLQLPTGWWAEWALPTALTASTLGTPRLKCVILRYILSSLPHMVAPSAPSPGDWAGREGLSFCQVQESAGLRIRVPTYLPHISFSFTQIPPHAFMCSPVH